MGKSQVANAKLIEFVEFQEVERGVVVVFYILYMKIREHFIVSSTCEM